MTVGVTVSLSVWLISFTVKKYNFFFFDFCVPNSQLLLCNTMSGLTVSSCYIKRSFDLHPKLPKGGLL